MLLPPLIQAAAEPGLVLLLAALLLGAVVVTSRS